MTLRTAIYSRTSAAFPLTADEQARDLQQLAADRGWNVVAVHRDNAPVGGKSAERRPGLATLMRAVEAGTYNVIIVQSINLLGRDLLDLVGFLAVLKSANVRLVCPSDGIDTANADGNGLLDIGVLFNTYIRFSKRERVVAGKQRARQAGVKFGRPSVPGSKINRVKDALSSGMGIREAGRAHRLSPTSVLRVRDGMRAAGLLPDVRPS
jgi:DNA invertase Pin-like site-specific DNA recombinase